jgi:hypothetical protein
MQQSLQQSLERKRPMQERLAEAEEEAVEQGERARARNRASERARERDIWERERVEPPRQMWGGSGQMEGGRARARWVGRGGEGVVWMSVGDLHLYATTALCY